MLKLASDGIKRSECRLTPSEAQLSRLLMLAFCLRSSSRLATFRIMSLDPGTFSFLQVQAQRGAAQPAAEAGVPGHRGGCVAADSLHPAAGAPLLGLSVALGTVNICFFQLTWSFVLFLQAVLGRRLVVGEVYDIMGRVQALLVRAHAAPVRQVASAVSSSGYDTA